MTAPRSRKSEITYRRYLRGTKAKKLDCIFCAIDDNSERILKQGTFFRLVHNKFPYSLWDGQAVTDHLMIIPKQHTDTLADLPPKAAQEFVQLMSEYESQGYNVWARAPNSIIKTVPHQHTHLIKLSRRKIRVLIYSFKPYFRFVR